MQRPQGENDDAGAPPAGAPAGGGAAGGGGLLKRIAAVVPTSDGPTAEELAEKTETLRTFIQERTEALKAQV